MKCLKCGAELTDDTKFCSYCGQKVEYENFDDTDDKLYEEFENNINEKGINSLSKKAKLDKLEKISICLLGIFVIMFFYSFLNNNIFLGIVTILQILLISTAILIKRNLINNLPFKINFYIPFIISIVILFFYPFLSGSKEKSTNLEDISGFNVKMEVICHENLFFSKYDIEVYVDDSFKGEISHGGSKEYNIKLEEGVHTIRFESAEDSDHTGTVKVKILKEEDLKFKLSCTSSGIKIKTVIGNVVKEEDLKTESEKNKDNKKEEKDDKKEENKNIDSKEKENITESKVENIEIINDSVYYKGKNCIDIKNKFEEIGFKNIKFEPNITTDSGIEVNSIDIVLINGKEFKKGDKFESNSEIIIKYWKLSEYNKAYIKKCTTYNIYYIFNTDNKTFVNFVDNDKYISKGTYTGEFSTGVRLNYVADGFKETIIEKGRYKVILIDSNGLKFDDFEICDIEEAKNALESIK